MTRVLASLAVVVMTMSLLGGCRSMTGKSFGQNIDDKTVTAGVKTKLVADRARNLVAVDVDTNQGVVYLSGNVSTARQKADAERIARSVDGVRNVVNNLQVAGAASASAHAQAPMASPATSPVGSEVRRHSVAGEVIDVDTSRGRLQVRTAEGDLDLHFPPAALSSVRKGDRVTVDLGLHPAR
jgi:hyperosmotically inducible protein